MGASASVKANLALTTLKGGFSTRIDVASTTTHVEGFYRHDEQTERHCVLEKQLQRAPDCTPEQLLRALRRGGTHVVTAVTYGFRVRVRFVETTHTQHTSSSSHHHGWIGGLVGQGMQAMLSSLTATCDSARRPTVSVRYEANLVQSEAPEYTIAGARRFLANLPKMMAATNGGRGGVISMELLPVQAVLADFQRLPRDSPFYDALNFARGCESEIKSRVVATATAAKLSERARACVAATARAVASRACAMSSSCAGMARALHRNATRLVTHHVATLLDRVTRDRTAKSLAAVPAEARRVCERVATVEKELEAFSRQAASLEAACDGWLVLGGPSGGAVTVGSVLGASSSMCVAWHPRQLQQLLADYRVDEDVAVLCCFSPPPFTHLATDVQCLTSMVDSNLGCVIGVLVTEARARPRGVKGGDHERVLFHNGGAVDTKYTRPATPTLETVVVVPPPGCHGCFTPRVQVTWKPGTDGAPATTFQVQAGSIQVDPDTWSDSSGNVTNVVTSAQLLACTLSVPGHTQLDSVLVRVRALDVSGVAGSPWCSKRLQVADVT